MKCHDCPVAAGLACLGESHGPVCAQKRADDRWVDKLRSLAEGRPYVEPTAQPVDYSTPPRPGPDPADWSPTPEAPPHATYPRVDHLAPLRLARACDHSAGRPESCGCADKVICLMGLGRGPGGGPGMEVYLTECVACSHGGPIVD